MQMLKTLFKRIIFPSAPISIIFVGIAAVLLSCTFTLHNNDTAFAYLSYAFSTYALIVACCQISALISKGKRFVYENKHIGRLLSDRQYLLIVSLYWSIVINAIFVVVKVISGMVYRSVWFGAIALYYLIFILIRVCLLLKTRGQELGKDKNYEYKQYRFCGMMLLILNLALTAITFQMVRLGHGSRFPGMLIYVAALYVFYAVITAATSLVRYRKCDSPLIASIKVINFITAAVSMLLLQTAMLVSFGGTPKFQNIINVITSGVVCLLTLGIAAYMIFNGYIKIRNLERTDY